MRLSAERRVTFSNSEQPDSLLCTAANDAQRTDRRTSRLGVGYGGVLDHRKGFTPALLSILVGIWKKALSDLQKVISAKPERAGPAVFLSIGELSVAAALALIAVAVDVCFSARMGLLAYPPYYDGISYVVGAKSLFYRLGQLDVNPRFLRNYAMTPFWDGSIVLGFLLLGEGEWQAYAVRFWPIFLLLLLVFYAIGRRGCSQVTWLAVAFTTLLPTISVGLRASLLDSSIELWNSSTASATLRPNAGLQWYLADLRPDLLFAVLLLWTVVPLIESVHTLDRRKWLISGTSAGLAVLVKASMSPALLVAWAITMAYVLTANRHQLRSTVSTGLWTLLPLAVLVAPWALVGGARVTFQYIWANAIGPQRVFWSNPNPTLLSELGYYWSYFPVHMGNFEGWTILAVGLALSLYSFRKKIRRKDNRIIAYLGVSAALWILVSATTAKNYFAGLPFYLLLWLFSWTAVASFLRTASRRNRIVAWLLPLILCMYVGFHVVGGVYAFQSWPTTATLVGQENRQVTQSIAADLRASLTNNDTFMWAPAYGFPATLEYYMMDKTGGYPRSISINMERMLEESPEQFIDEAVGNCKAVMAYEEDIGKVVRFAWVPAPAQPYFRAIAEWVKQPDSGYTSARTYYIMTEDGYLTLHLYLKSNSTVTNEMAEWGRTGTLATGSLGYVFPEPDNSRLGSPKDQFH
jgi:hypothetical protein